MRQVRGLVLGLMILSAETQKWTIRTYVTTDHFLGKLFLHKLAKDWSKHVTKLLHFVDNSKGEHIRISILF